MLMADYSYLKILETLEYRTNKKKKRKKDNQANKYDINKASEIIGKINSKISTAIINQDIFVDLITISNSLNDNNKKIDSGEAVLISYLIEKNRLDNSSYLLTGDKNCLRALGINQFAEIVKPIKGKIWCFEQLILKNIEKYGFEFVQNKVYPFRDCDNNLKLIFGYSEKSPEKIVKEDLGKEISRLMKDSGNILYPYPD